MYVVQATYIGIKMAASSGGSQSGSSTSSSSAPTADLGSYLMEVKQALANLMSEASVALQQNAELDQAAKLPENTPANKLDKCLEDFYHKVDQLQSQLELIEATERQSQLSAKYSPMTVSMKTDEGVESQTYSEYLSTAKTQVRVAKQLQDLLMEFSKAQFSRS